MIFLPHTSRVTIGYCSIFYLILLRLVHIKNHPLQLLSVSLSKYYDHIALKFLWILVDNGRIVDGIVLNFIFLHRKRKKKIWVHLWFVLSFIFAFIFYFFICAMKVKLCTILDFWNILDKVLHLTIFCF